MKWFRRSTTLYIGKRHWLCNYKEDCQTAKSIKKPHLKFQQVRTLDWQGLGPLIERMVPLNSWSLRGEIWTSALLHMTRLFHDFTALVDLPQGMLSDNDEFISILVTQTAIKLLPPWKVFFWNAYCILQYSQDQKVNSLSMFIMQPTDTKRYQEAIGSRVSAPAPLEMLRIPTGRWQISASQTETRSVHRQHSPTKEPLHCSIP